MAGRIPQSFINDLLARIDIVDVIDARLSLRKAGRNYQALCPFHNEKTASFSVNPEKQFYYCFGCGATGTALTFLMEHDRLEFVAAVEALAQIAGVEVPRERGARVDDERHERLLKILEDAAVYYRRMLRSHAEAARAVEYLKARGLTGVVARDFGIGFAPPGWDGVRSALSSFGDADLIAAGLLVKNEQGRIYDRFRDRVMFPIRNTRGRVIGFGGRVLGDEKPKYLNSPETDVFHKGRELYGLYEARKALRRIDRLLVVEGYMDVVALAQSGIANAVATLGTATGVPHFEKLFRQAPEVVCCFDGDQAGRDAAWKALIVALPTLTAGHQLSFVFLPDGEDPDSLVRKEGKERFAERVGGAVGAAEYLFQHLSIGLDLTTMDGRARLAELALPYLRTIPEGVLRELAMERLASIARMSPDALVRGAKVVKRAPTNRPTPRAQGLSRLSERLLAILLKHPEYLKALDEHRRARLVGIGDSLLGNVVRYFAGQPDADLGSLLGYWAGQEGHSTLVELADRPLVLSGEALASEFDGAVNQCLTAIERANRRAFLDVLRAEGSTEALAQYWSLKRKAD
ncbi:MAG TPA: DNA primase [Pseudomonadales bacterium]|nr:DNA primase [Pseudomonadales bacterium]